MSRGRTVEIQFIDLGLIPYDAALTRQHELHLQVCQGRRPGTVLILEHPPVITVTRRASEAGHVLASRQVLRDEGIELTSTDRGGDVTYHGPGQLVAYPIVPLESIGLNVRQYVAALQRSIIRALSQFGISGRTDPAGIGVWVNAPADGGQGGGGEKIAAIGVRVSRWVTLHGLAINVTTNLAHFRHIVPCGLAAPVTSAQKLLGARCPSMDQMKHALMQSLAIELRPPEAQ